MSFHGGLIGVIVAVWIFAYKFRQILLGSGRFCCSFCSFGLAAGRIGNFINGEL